MAFLEATQTISRMMMEKLDEFVSEIDNVHMVWLQEIEQEAYRMFSGESSTEPELMPKTPSQKRRPRKKRVSLGLQDDARTRRRFSHGRRSNLAASSVKKLELVFEEESQPQPTSSSVEPPPPVSPVGLVCREVKEEEPPLPQFTGKAEPAEQDIDMNEHPPCPSSTSLPKALVQISASDRRSAEAARTSPPVVAVVTEPQAATPPGRTATKVAIAGKPSRPSRVSLSLRHSAAGLRGRQTLESVRRASRRSLLKKVKAHASNSTFSGTEDSSAEADDEDEHQPEKLSEATEVTGQPEQVSVSGSRVSSAAGSSRLHTDDAIVQSQSPVTRSSKRKAEEHPESSQKKTGQKNTVVRPNMKAFFQTVQRNQMLMMTPNSLGRTGVMKSFIKHTTPLKVDTMAKERQKLEALKKKQEQEEERIKKMEEEKKKKQEELKRKREERLRKATESRAKEEQKEEEKKRKMEQKRAQMEEKNDKLRMERLAEEKLKKQLALKHQEEIDNRRKLEEETRLRKIQQAEEEEKRQQALQAKRRAEEEAHRAQKLAEARRAQELKEQERAERERAEALQREVERAAREKERKEAERRKELEEQRKKAEQQRLAEEERAAQRLAEERAAQRLAEERAEAERAAKQRLAEAAAKKQPLGQSAALNVTMDVEASVIKTPTGKDKPGLNVTVDVEKPDDYGMDQNSDDSTDDESAPRKPIPSWAEGHKLQQTLLKEYFNPPDLHALFGAIAPINLEEIFYTKKPRFNKRTSSAVWHSPPK